MYSQNNDVRPVAQTQKLAVEVIEWRSLERNTLRGFATVRFPAMRMAISDVSVHEKDGSRWASLPSKPRVGADKRALTDGKGKVKYSRLFHFDGREVERALSDAIVRALDTYQRGDR